MIVGIVFAIIRLEDVRLHPVLAPVCSVDFPKTMKLEHEEEGSVVGRLWHF